MDNDISTEQMTIPKRKEPPGEPGIFYYAPRNRPHIMNSSYRTDSDEFLVVSVYPVRNKELGLYVSALGIYVPGLNHVPMSDFPPGDWWGPLPRPANE